MTENEEVRLSEVAGEISFPAIPRGKIARALRRAYEIYVQDSFGANPFLLNSLFYYGVSDTLESSNFFAINVLSQIIRRENLAFDVANFANLASSPRVFNLISEGGFMAGDSVILRGTNKFGHYGDNDRDKIIFEQLVNYVDNLRSPVLMKGVRVEPDDDSKANNLKVVKGDSFSYIHDVRLSIQGSFYITDEHNLPILCKNGRYGWYVSDTSLSGLARHESDLYAWCSLAASPIGSHIILVSRVEGAQNLERVLVA